jgi:glyoxylase-like metal-dependent hydrolase (beta-lactamase superfamily II)
MRRALALAGLLAAGALSLTVAAYQAPAAAPRTIEVKKLKDNLYLLKGGGGNTTVFVQTNGVTVVDTKNPGWGQPILDKIKELTPKPVTTIINTHTHGDHVSGNVEFPATVDVVVQENTAANMKKMLPVTGLAQPGAPTPPNIFDQNGGKGLAKKTFKDKMTLGSGADRIDLFYFGRAHTNGDAWVLFPALRVVAAGDTYAWDNQPPILDANNGGSGVDIPDTLMKAHAALNKQADAIITGHSDVASFDDLKKWADFNRQFLDEMKAAKKTGKTPEQVAREWKAPANFQMGANEQAQKAMMFRLQSNVETTFKELK